MAKKTKSTSKAFQASGRILRSSTGLIIVGIIVASLGWYIGGSTKYMLFGFGGCMMLLSAVVAATQLGE